MPHQHYFLKLSSGFPRPSDERVAEQERIHRAWLNGEDTASGAYDHANVYPARPEPGEDPRERFEVVECDCAFPNMP